MNGKIIGIILGVAIMVVWAVVIRYMVLAEEEHERWVEQCKWQAKVNQLQVIKINGD